MRLVIKQLGHGLHVLLGHISGALTGCYLAIKLNDTLTLFITLF